MNLKPSYVIFVLLADAVLAYGAEKSEWSIFVADPFIFAQAFVLSLRSGTAQLGALVAFTATLLYLLALALLFPVPYFTPPFQYPQDITLVQEYSPGAKSFAYAPALILLVVLPAYAYRPSTPIYRSSTRSLLALHFLVVSIAILLFRVPFNGTTLGLIFAWMYQMLITDPFTRFQCLLWGLYLIDGWSGVVAWKCVQSRGFGRVAVFLIIPIAAALLHLLLVTSWHQVAFRSIASTYYPRLALIHCLAFAAVVILLRATEDQAEPGMPAAQRA